MRTVSTELQDMLDLDGCETQTTLDLQLADGVTEYLFATRDLTFEKGEYAGDLVTGEDIEQTIGSATDRVTVSVQNVDKVFGGVAMSGDLTRARAVVGRYYHDPAGRVTDTWVELFRGEVLPQPVVEGEARLEIVSDLIAAGYCVGDWALWDNCVLVYKGELCGYSGGLTSCNKRRFSDGGCRGHDNEHRFGGMEYPPQKRTAPSGGTGGGGIPPRCFAGDTKIHLTMGGQIDLKTLYRLREKYIGGPILSFDENGNLAGDTLVNVMRSQASFGEMVFVRFYGRPATRVKRRHRFLTESNGFQEIGTLRRGDAVMRLGPDGKLVPEKIQWIYPSRSPLEWVYNVTTKVHHRFFADGCAVHNAKFPEDI